METTTRIAIIVALVFGLGAAVQTMRLSLERKHMESVQYCYELKCQELLLQWDLLHTIWLTDSNYWDRFVATKEYEALDRFMDRDWEDFYEIWPSDTLRWDTVPERRAE